MFVCARDSVHYCGQLAPTSHAYYLITINECQALRKKGEKEFVPETRTWDLSISQAP